MNEFSDLRGTEIAVIGMACRFPSAADIDQFWANLRDGVEGIRFFRDDELLAAGVSAETLNHPNYIKARAVLDDCGQFDAAFFGFSPREAEILDVQQRVFLECAWTALEDAGYDAQTSEELIGLFAGVGISSYWLNNLVGQNGGGSADAYQTWLANDKDFLATRVAYKLNLRGACLSVQTACSTSLVAIHLACQSLLSGESDMALAGGATISLPQMSGYFYQEGMILSADGHCRAFDAQASGTVGGSGAGIVVLKRLEDALADGDTIHAVVRGSAINNDGAHKIGYTAPSQEGQAKVIAEALALADVEPEAIGYIEAHGTGTRLGDPIEMAALRQVFGRDHHPIVGSVKTNIGHLDTAAGVAGFIKTVLALKHAQLPPTLHFQTPNPEISEPFPVRPALSAWEQTERLAGVSSFGIGGTNAHVVLEAFESEPRLSSGQAELLVMSAQSQSALSQVVERVDSHLRGNDSLPLQDVAFTLANGRRAFNWRTFAVTDCQISDTEGSLSTQGVDETYSVLRGAYPEGVTQYAVRNTFQPNEFLKSHTAYRQAKSSPRVAFLFSGQGTQYARMAMGLYEQNAVFREALDECDRILGTRMGRTLIGLLRSGVDLTATRLAQPVLFAVAYALSQMWLALGVRPIMMLGHSLGEFVTACLAGVFSLEDGLRLIVKRGTLMQSMTTGQMLSVLAGVDALDLPAGVEVAVVNGVEQTVVAGSAENVAQYEKTLQAQQIMCRRLHTSHAYHSASMTAAAEQFATFMATIDLHPPQSPYISNVTGALAADEVTDPAYWGRQLRGTVQFAKGLETLFAAQPDVLLEIGAGETLSKLARQMDRSVVAVSSLPSAKSDVDDRATVLNAVGTLWTTGVEIDWAAFYEGEDRRRVSLPTYPFERQRYWVEPQAAAPVRHQTMGFYLPSWERSLRPRGDESAENTLIITDHSDLANALTAQLGTRAVTIELSELETAVIPQNIIAFVEGGNAVEIFADFLQLIQSLGDAPTTLTLVTRGLQDVTGRDPVVPERAVLIGLVRVLRQEIETIQGRIVDVDDGNVAWLARQIVAEATGDDLIVAYRGKQRWVPSFVPVEVEHEAAMGLRDEGVYLITGGMGGIGFALAEQIAKSADSPHLALLGRSPADPQKIAHLSALGAQVLPLQADVADKAQLSTAIETARRQFGENNGVIHAAAIAGGGLLLTKAREEVSAEFAAPITGALLLDELLTEDLDFFVLCSSHTSAVGGVGQAAYSAANAFQDAFAHWRSRRAPTLAINWDRWQAVGMAVDLERVLDELGVDAATTGLTREAGKAAFARLISADVTPQIIVSTVDFPALVAASNRYGLGNLAADETTTRYERPMLATDFAAPEGETEVAIAAVWEAVLGIGGIGRNDNFSDLGGDSLIALKLIARLQDALGMNLQIRTLYDEPTVSALAQYVETVRWLEVGVIDDDADFEFEEGVL